MRVLKTLHHRRPRRVLVNSKYIIIEYTTQ